MQNLIERIQAFNRGRNPQLLSQKYQQMRADQFAFFRGTCHLFYEDWPAQSPLDKAPATWICGDLHLHNLGIYKADNRLVYFNINDFDEAALAPCTWDLARLLTCLLISAHMLNIPEDSALKLCSLTLEIYTRTISRAHVRTLEEEEVTSFIKDLNARVKNRRRKQFLDTLTETHNGQRTFRIDGKHFNAIPEIERDRLVTFIERWAANRTDAAFFKVLDVAQRIAGIGSLGLTRYVLLVEGKGSPDQNYLLDFKEAAPSSLSPYLKLAQPHWRNEAERVVSIQQWVQVMPPAMLTAVEFDGKGYILRELQPKEDKVNVEQLGTKMEHWEEVVTVIAKILAWDQLHSGGQYGSATAPELIEFAQTTHWQDVLLKYVQLYKHQVAQDYHTFCSAFDNGAFSI